MILASASSAGLLCALGAALAYGVAAVAAPRIGDGATRMVLLAAWLLHALTLALGLAESPARFGFAPALSVTAWLVLTVYAVESHVLPELNARWALSGLGAAAVLVAQLFPGAPLPAVASTWLSLHWALGIASYGLFAAAVVHAALMTRAERRIRLAADPRSGVPLLTLERLTFRFVGAGFLLLTATLLAGWLFGQHLYGTTGVGWKWDHKSVFSVLSWLTFATLLIGRARFGWRGRRAVRFLYAGAALLLLGYAGSRFVLEVILGRSA